MSSSPMVNLSLKLAFVASIAIHVILWPSYAHIVFACALALEALATYFMTPRNELEGKVYSPSLLFFHDEKCPRSYGSLVIILFYLLYTFLWFAHDEIAVQPRMTTWIHDDFVHNYTFTDRANNPFPHLEVTDSESKKMRDNSYEWRRSFSVPAIPVYGSIRDAYVNKAPIQCQLGAPPTGNNSNATTLHPPPFSCFATNLYAESPPDGFSHSILPVPAQFYAVDVTVTPPPNVACHALETYRIVLDARGNIENGLDYPASSILQKGPSSLLARACDLFNISGWCLHFQHTFSHADYASRVATKCAEGGGALTFRLPPRALDVEPSTGRVGLDALLVTRGARVDLSFTWQEPPSSDWSSSFITSFQRPWVNPDEDAATDWRRSSSNTAVFFKFFFLVIPFLLVWYYLTVHFLTVVVDSQVLLLCIFVLLPSILLFLSMGAWLPMAGSIICVVAINHAPEGSEATTGWRAMIRPFLFFLTAACNSIQFVWLLVLVGQAGWSSFLYEASLKQLADLSSSFVISDSTSPTWIGLLLPCLLLMNLMFLLGSAICIVLETLPRLSSR